MTDMAELVHPAEPRSRVYDVVIADDDAAVVAALAGLIGDHPNLDVVGVAASGAEAAEQCERLRPDLAVVDVMMPSGGVVAVQDILAVSSRTLVVAYTAMADSRTRRRLLTAGAAAVLTKGGGDDLPAVLHRLLTE